MKSIARSIAGTLSLMALVVGPVALIVVELHGKHSDVGWKIAGAVYLLVFLIPANVLVVRRWFQSRARERAGTAELTEFVEERRRQDGRVARRPLPGRG